MNHDPEFGKRLPIASKKKNTAQLNNAGIYMYTRVQYHRDGKNEERTIGTRGGKTRTRAQSGVKSRLCAAAVENKNKESTTP